MIRLGDVAQGRDNNFNLIRMIAAVGVLVSHAWPISLGPDAVQPMQRTWGYTLGELSVLVFFVISGYLIAASFERSPNRVRFLVSRALRLFPGLAVSIAFVAFVLGPIATTLPIAEYLRHPGTWTFLLRNVALVRPQYGLPGVFGSNPYPDIEGSIWTLAHEVGCYLALFVAGVVGFFGRPTLGAVLLTLHILGWSVARAVGLTLSPGLAAFYIFTVSFGFGTLLYLIRGRLPLSLPLALAFCGLAWLARGTPFDLPSLVVAIGYGSFWLAYVPTGRVRAYNRLGDYSYGFYIYAFPVQGFVVWVAGSTTPLLNIAWALPLTMVPSVLSWHLVEAPALRARDRIVARLSGRGTVGDPGLHGRPPVG